MSDSSEGIVISSGSGSFLPTIGIECHVQLKTATKLFAGVANDARQAEPNTLISHICLGMPGALPVLNHQALILAMRAGFALGTTPQKVSQFERKHYYYPDLPNGYQITQLEKPIIVGGYVDISVSGESSRVNINRVQLEADAGKSSHPAGQDYSLVDLNRAGTPLLEIVSEPDMHSAAAAKAYVHELYLLMRYADVSDCDLSQGNMRFDVNVSLSRHAEELGTRTETKNLNSFRSVEKTVEYEIKRQTELLLRGGAVEQQTLGWDEAKQKTFAQRTKEDAHDYRYFPDPDIPPVVLDDIAISDVEASMPIMPAKVRGYLSKLGLDSSSVELLVLHNRAGMFLVELIDSGCNSAYVKRIAKWLAGEAQALVSGAKLNWDTLVLSRDDLVSLAILVEENKINSTGAKAVLHLLLNKSDDPIKLANDLNLLQETDEKEALHIVEKVVQQNPEAAADVLRGEQKAIGFLVGQIMKESKGKANPKLAEQLVRRVLKI